MCILLKFDNAKFGVSSLCFSKVIEEKPSTSPLVQEGLRVKVNNFNNTTGYPRTGN